VPGAADVINPSLAPWFQAAKTSRADMFMIGDSMVWVNGDGWDAGFIDSLAKHTGLAASGLLQTGVEGDGYGAGVAWQSNFDLSSAAVRPDRRGYVWRDIAVTAGPNPAQEYLTATLNTTLKTSTGIDWKLYAVPTANAPNAQGKFDSYARLGESPWLPYTQPKTYTVDMPASGLNKLTLHYDLPKGFEGRSLEMHLTNAQNMSVLYNRMVVPGAKGASLTSWGYGGHSILSFYYDYWLGQGMTPEGRKAWFDALTEGGSGKLNIVIEEGFNDRGESRPSLAGTTPGNSAQAFGDNVKGFMNKIRQEWSAAGRNATDLTFTLLGTYEDHYEAMADENNGAGILHGYSYALQQIALTDPQVSFINMLNHAPRYDEAVKRGYMMDDVHATRAGTTVYSEMAIDTLQSYAGVNTTGGYAWKPDADGEWGTPANWKGGVPPNSTFGMARFAEAATSRRNIHVDAVALQTLQFDNPNGYTINGGTIRMISGSSEPARLNVMSGEHVINATVKVDSSLVATVPYGTKLSVKGDFNFAPGTTLTKVGRGELEVKNLRADALTITGGTVRVMPNGGASGISYIKGLEIDQSAGGALDLTDNDIVIQYTGASPLEKLRALVLAGYAEAADSTRTGIISSTSQQHGGAEILQLFDNAVVQTKDWPPGSGNTIPTNAIVGMYTYFGDANMDGMVTPDDYLTVDSNLGRASGMGWLVGDFDMNGTVTADDYLAIDSNLGRGQSVGMATAGSLVAVPEPAAVGITALALGAGMARRRRGGRA
jgi:hypothetical protein